MAHFLRARVAFFDLDKRIVLRDAPDNSFEVVLAPDELEKAVAVNVAAKDRYFGIKLDAVDEGEVPKPLRFSLEIRWSPEGCSPNCPVLDPRVPGQREVIVFEVPLLTGCADTARCKCNLFLG